MTIASHISRMFARKTNGLPPDPQYPADLLELGFRVNEQGQFVKTINGEFFDFFHTDNDRANETRKEALHECARQVVIDELAKYGVKELYLTGEDGTEVVETKPGVKHTRILATDAKALSEKKDVLVVVGEHCQDPGIWAYRTLMKEGGLTSGSAVGLVEKLQVVGLDASRNEGSAVGTKMRNKSTQTGMEMSTEGVQRSGSVVSTTTDRVPGIVMLNPGQLLYSHELNHCMTQVTWWARPKSSAIGDHYQINETHNRVPGHRTPEEHISTVFEHVLHQLLKDDVRLWIVGIADGAENFIEYMNLTLYNATSLKNAGSAGNVAAMALMQTTHNPNNLQSLTLRHDLEMYGRSWIMSSKPKGTFINAPSAMKRIVHPSDEVEAEKGPLAELIEETKSEEEGRQLAQVKTQDTEMTITNHTPIITAKSGNEIAAPDDYDLDDLKPAEKHEKRDLVSTGSHPIPIPQGGKGLSIEIDRSSEVHSLGSHDSSVPESLMYARSNPSKASVQEGGSPPLHKSITSLISEVSASSGRSVTGERLSQSSCSDTDSISNQLGHANPMDASTSSIMEGSYDYSKEVVSCPTFSGGVDINELIWPNVMDEVLDWFKTVAERMERRGKAPK